MSSGCQGDYELGEGEVGWIASVELVVTIGKEVRERVFGGVKGV